LSTTLPSWGVEADCSKLWVQQLRTPCHQSDAWCARNDVVHKYGKELEIVVTTRRSTISTNCSHCRSAAGLSLLVSQAVCRPAYLTTLIEIVASGSRPAYKQQINVTTKA